MARPDSDKVSDPSPGIAAANTPADTTANSVESTVANSVASAIERLRERCADDSDFLGALQSAAWQSANEGRQEAARLYLHRVFEMGYGRPNEAWRMLGLGGEMERASAYAAAADCYRRGLLTEELATGTFDGGRLDRRVLRYFLRNNLAYCLAVLGHGVEAESFARQAVAVNPTRHNAHKNLGLALRLQGRLGEAAACFAQARDLCPADGRAAALLESVQEEMAAAAR